MPTIKKALPIREIRKQIRHLDHVLDGRVVGTTHDYAEFNHLEIDRGRFLTEADNEKVPELRRARRRDRQDPLPLSRTRSASRSSSAPTTTRSSA